jgi:hypothetical protein
MAQKQQLVRRGAHDLDLTVAVRSGSVTRVRNGWYTTIAAGDPRVLAVRVGGRLTGISAIRAMGGWVLDRHPLHVSLPYNAARLRDRNDRRRRLRPPGRGVVLHWDDPDLGTRGDAMTVSLRDALARVILDETRETAIAAFDWALHAGLLEMFDVEAIMLGVPKSRRFGTDWFDPACESLPESLSRTRLRQAGHELVSQVALETGEAVDLVVDGIVGLEVDGEEFHRDRFEQDRRKDAQIILEHMHPFRPSARMVFHDWPVVLAAVEEAIASRAPSVSVGNSGTKGRHARRRRLPPSAHAPTPEFPKRPSAGMGVGPRALGEG